MSNQLRDFARLPKVQSLTGLSRSAIYQKISEGLFPKPIRLGSKTVVWDLSEIAQWQAARIKERDAAMA